MIRKDYQERKKRKEKKDHVNGPGDISDIKFFKKQGHKILQKTEVQSRTKLQEFPLSSKRGG